jgi:hypothetical protein
LFKFFLKVQLKFSTQGQSGLPTISKRFEFKDVKARATVIYNKWAIKFTPTAKAEDIHIRPVWPVSFLLPSH